MMNQLENEFLDVYKRVDRICADMYSSDNGISEYIHQMEQKYSIGRFKIAKWEESYQLLKHLRWLRNQLVHDVNPERCTNGDLYSLKTFYDKILSQEDPLAMLYKVEKSAVIKQKTSEVWGENSKKSMNGPVNKAENGRAIALIIGLVVLVAVLIILILGKI